MDRELIPWDMRMTRQEARDKGEQFYYDPLRNCKKHGNAIRYASNGKCKECVQAYTFYHPKTY